MANKYLIGFLTVVILAASIYVMLPGQVRIDVGKTATEFRVWEDNSWVLSGTERTIIMDGSKIMRAKNRSVESFIDGNITKIIRTANFKDGIVAIDTYTFDGSTDDVTLFPVEHSVDIINANGKIFYYEVKNLLYTGKTTIPVYSPMEFGHNMKIEWSKGNYYSKIFKYKYLNEGKLMVRYRIDSDSFSAETRLFDPPAETGPVINIVYPLNTSYITNVSEINFTATDPNPDVCWYSSDAGITNSTSISFSENFTGVSSSLGSNSVTVYCNDTLGDVGSSTRAYSLDSIQYAPNSNVTNSSYAGTGEVFVNVSINPVLDYKNISYNYYNLSSNEITLVSKAAYNDEQKYADFDGDGDYINVGTSDGYNFTDGFSISMVVEPRALSNSGYFFNQHGSGNSTTGGILFWHATGHDGSIQLNVLTPATVLVVGFRSDTDCLNIDTKTTIAATWDGTKSLTDSIKLYCDGEEVGINDTSSSTGVYTFPSGSNTIGGRIYDNVRNFNGTMDNIVIFDTNISAEEVKNLYNLNLDYYDGSTNNVTSYFNFDNGVDNFQDKIGINNGTAVGNTYTSSYGEVSLGSYLFDFNPIYWDVLLYDESNISYALDLRYIGAEEINLTLNYGKANLTAELGTSIEINATSNIYNISIDVDHPEYGINYVNDFLSTGFNLIIDYFRKITFSNLLTYMELFFSGEDSENISLTFHQYDEVDSVKFNMSGNASDIYFYSDSSIDRFYSGYLDGSNMNSNSFFSISDGLVDETSLFYQLSQSQIAYILVDTMTDLLNISITILGEKFGLNYSNNFTTNEDINDIDNLLTESNYGGGFIMPPGNDLAEFIVDDFEDSSINTTVIKIDYPNNIYYICGGGFYTSSCDPGDEWSVTVSNGESSGSLNLDYSFDEEVSSGSQTESINIGFYISHNYINVWTPKNILFNFNYYHTGDERESSQDCTAYTQAIIGNNVVWQSPWQQCDAKYSDDCDEFSESITTMDFNATRLDNESWSVEITGVERTYGTNLSNGVCGSYNFVYNWTGGYINKTYSNPGGSCAFSNSIESLNNIIYVNLASASDFLEITKEFRINTYNHGRYDEDDNRGCKDIQTEIQVENVNQTLYNQTSGWAYSNQIFNSDSDISSAGMLQSVLLIYGKNDSIHKYLSADNGDNYQEIIDGNLTALSFPGKDIKYAFYFNLTEPGYFTKSIALFNTSVFSPEGYPSNIVIDIGNDGIYEGLFSGELNETTGPYNFSYNDYDPTGKFSQLSYISDNMGLLPIAIYSATVGELNLTELIYSYDPNPININATNLEDRLVNLTGFGNITILVNATNGTINFTDLKQDYAGGNDTITITAHNDDYSLNETFSSLYYYSRWEYEWGPNNVEWLYFSPPSPVSENITPYGQDGGVPILNITNYGYGSPGALLSLYQDGDLSCVNTTISLTNNKSEGNLIGEFWLDLENMTYLEEVPIYLFADYNCNYTTWRTFEPQLYFRQCVDGGLCSTKLV